MKFDFLEKGTARLMCLPLADTNYLTARAVYGRVIQPVTQGANGFKTISANVILLVNKEGYCWRLFTCHLWHVFKRVVERRS